MDFKLYNTITHRLESFKPEDKNEVRLYTCGPTVYNRSHIGNLRAFLMADLLKRTLEFNNYNVKWVMNVTDVDDKTIANTIKTFGPKAGVEELKKFTDVFFQFFQNDLQKVNINPKTIQFVKVTEKIADIQLYIIKLIEKGFAYKAEDGSTYFNIEKYQEAFGDYGILVGDKFLQGKKVGARIKVDEYEKENLSDFALWKVHGPDDGNIFWDHPVLGRGRPGWHIECTLINFYAFNGHSTDIHTGGVDLIFPHHTNEIAQAQPIYGKNRFVQHWLHSEHILLDGKKMSKSLNNFYTLDDLSEKNIGNGNSLRFLILQSGYRTQINITKESLKAAESGLNNLKNKIMALNISDQEQKFWPDPKNNPKIIELLNLTINNDLNSPELLASLQRELSGNSYSREEMIIFINAANSIIGIDFSVDNLIVEISERTQKLLEQRDLARANKNFKLSDQLRGELEKLGFEVLDTSEGTVLKNSHQK